MTGAPSARLRDLAQGAGVATEHHDIAGTLHQVPAPVLVGVLEALGLPAGDDAAVEEAHAELHRRAWCSPAEPTTVCWDGRAPSVVVRRPATAAETPVEAVIELEGGDERHVVVGADGLERVAGAAVDGVDHVAQRVGLGADLPLGVHRVRLSSAGAAPEAVTHLLVAPSLAPAPGRGWGVFAPVHALRRSGRGGAGHLGDLAALADWVAGLGGGLIGTLPLLATFDDEASPYAPVSRVAWNERHLDLAALPELAGTRWADRAADGPADRLVDWAAEVTGVRTALAAAVERLSDRRRDELEAFCRARPEVDRLASWRAAVDRGGPPAPGGDLGSGSPDGALVHRYAQWAMERQLAALAARLAGRGQSLYLDLPLGVHPSGFDVWRAPELFALTVEVGAPPDDFNPHGQAWGFPPLSPAASRVDGYAHLRAGLAHQMRHAGVVRLDHVMALHRLWWIPAGGSAAEGAYVHYPADELAAVVTLEAGRAGAVVVGENLGTVPPEVDRLLGEHRLVGMYATQFELDAAPHARRPPAGWMAVVNTHDMAPFAAYWQALDPAHRDRVREQLARDGAAPDGDDALAVLEALLGWLGASDAAQVVVSLEDLWGEVEPQNVPGTGPEVPNWRRQAALTIEELAADPAVAGRLGPLQAARRHDGIDRTGPGAAHPGAEEDDDGR